MGRIYEKRCVQMCNLCYPCNSVFLNGVNGCVWGKLHLMGSDTITFPHTMRNTAGSGLEPLSDPCVLYRI